MNRHWKLFRDLGFCLLAMSGILASCDVADPASSKPDTLKEEGDQPGVLQRAEPPPAKNWVDHGIMVPVGMSTWGRSTFAMADRDGKRLIFTKLWTGNKASYLLINAETGETDQIDPQEKGWGAYCVLWTPDNIIYDTMGSQLVAFDVNSRRLRHLGKFGKGMALEYLYAKDGTIYAAIYPSATLVSYNPQTDQFVNHGSLNNETWPQYLRPLVQDASGWIYGAIGLQEGQVVAFDPATGEKKPLIPEEKRRRGQPELFHGRDGQIYAEAEGWGRHRLSEGKATPVDHAAARAPKPDGMTFPDGSRLTKVNVPDRKLYVAEPGSKEAREVHFDYSSTGVPIYTIVAGPEGKIYGATGIPLRVWSFDLATGVAWNSGLGGFGGHINQFVRQGDILYGAVYSGGQLVQYDPRRPFDDVKMAQSTNPRLVHHAPEAADLYGRPHAVLAHSDGRHILVGGNAQRVLNGSGMLIYDTKTGQGEMLDRSQLLPDQGINAMTSLPDGDVLVGTSIHPPTAGSPGPATTAVLYRFNLASRNITGTWPLKPESPAVRDLVTGSDGLVYGLAEPARFFVFDPARGEFVHQEDINGYGDAAGFQAPRCLIQGPDGMLYALFQQAVLRIEPGSFRHRAISQPPEPITTGIAIQDGRLYFACRSHLLSCELNPPAPKESESPRPVAP